MGTTALLRIQSVVVARDGKDALLGVLAGAELLHGLRVISKLDFQ